MAETRTPAAFLTPKSFESLPLAGIAVWFTCLTFSSFVADITAFWIRIFAFFVSLLWSISLFIRKKEYKNIGNYFLVILNAVLIYTNAAGVNSVTRQSPFEGMKVKSNLDSIKTNYNKTAGVFELSMQSNWYPDYDMIVYIDSLQKQVHSLNYEKKGLLNEFSYIKDKIDEISKDSLAARYIKDFLKDFGRHYNDSTNFAIMKAEYKHIIDSIRSALEFREKNPIRQTSYYTVNGKKYTAEQMVSNQEIEINNWGRFANYLIDKANISKSEVDSLLLANGLKDYKTE